MGDEAPDFTLPASRELLRQRALDLDPNQYIWRRRIQRYGPRLDKPYPFYDWVAEARAAIVARGETPAALVAEPGGAELARPSRAFEPELGEAADPDPGGRIRRDRGELIHAESVLVPPTLAPGGAARVHLELSPIAASLERHLPGLATDTPCLGAHEHLDPVLFEDPFHLRRHVGVLAREELRAALHDRDSGAETAEHLRELEARGLPACPLPRTTAS